MEEHGQNALKNGHYDPLRSLYAQSDAANRGARFLLRRPAKQNSVGLQEKCTKCSQWTEVASNINFGEVVSQIITNHVFTTRKDGTMVTSMQSQEFEMDYDVSYRELSLASAGRDVSAKDRFQARARYTRGGKGRVVNGAHRRRDKKNYL